MRVAGLHLLQAPALIETPRPSVVAIVDDTGRLESLRRVTDDASLLDALGDAGPLEILAVDAPLAVPNARGQRDLERVMAWCDAPVFPTSRDRMTTVHGALRGADLAARLHAAAAQGAWEASPDQVLRQIAWERDHPPHAAPLDLGTYRAMWPALRAPVYRPKGPGRARPGGIDPAWRALSEVLDLGGWIPSGAGDDWSAIDDAACLDALCCAYAGVRALQGPGAGGAVRLGDAAAGRILVPADTNLAGRLAITLTRLRAEGAISI